VLLSSRKVLVLEDQFSSPRPCAWSSSPCPWSHPRKFKSSKIFEEWVGYRSMRNIKHHRLAVTEWQMGGLYAIVPRSDSSSCRSHRTVSQQCCCPRGKSLSSKILEDQFSSPRPCHHPWTSRIILVLEAWLLVLVLVLESQVLDNNTGIFSNFIHRNH